MHEQRKWYLETETALGKGTMKIAEMATKDLEHNINLVEKRSSSLQRINSSFERSFNVG